MPNYLSETAVDVCSRRMITLDLYKTEGANCPMSVEVCLMDADRYAREFSQLVRAPGGYVRLIQDARIRAVYKAGERVQQSDMREFFALTDEEYSEGKILCSKTHEYF